MAADSKNKVRLVHYIITGGVDTGEMILKG